MVVEVESQSVEIAMNASGLRDPARGGTGGPPVACKSYKKHRTATITRHALMLGLFVNQYAFGG